MSTNHIKKLIVLLLVLCFFNIPYAHADYYDGVKVNLVPEPIQGDIRIVSIGKIASEAYYNRPPIDVDTHEVTVAGKGINVFEYKITDPNFSSLANSFSRTHKIDVTLLPEQNSNAFVVLKEPNVDNAYKITLSKTYKAIFIQQIKNNQEYKRYVIPYPIELFKVYDISFHFGYESSGGSGGNRITVSELGISSLGTTPSAKVIFSKKLYEMGLDGPSQAYPLRFFAGNHSSVSKFTNEEIRIIRY